MYLYKILMNLISNKEGIMYEVKNVYGRIGIVLGMILTVVTVLYFTPMPEEYFLSCDRPCHPLDWPMICRVKMKIEMHRYTNDYCEFCPSNTSDCQKTCNTGNFHSTITINNKAFGPSIHVCQNDIVVVDVMNAIPGRSFTLHWRGQSQAEMPAMDGVPMVTQCSIPSYTTFQYKFRAANPGTHLWHAHSGINVVDGIFGALIVRQPHKVDQNKKYYDYDLKEHSLVLSEGVLDDPSGTGYPTRSLKVNGIASTLNHPAQILTVKPGKRYRFRVAYAGGVLNCPVNISLDNTIIKVIALDGNSVEPLEVTTVGLGKGERVDFVIETGESNVSPLDLRAVSKCYENVRGVHLLIKYEEEISEKGNRALNYTNTSPKTTIPNVERRIFSTTSCESKIGQICVGKMKSLIKMPNKLQEKKIDKKIFLVINNKKFQEKQHVSSSRIYSMNNITFVYPSSPLLSQNEDVSGSFKCNLYTKPSFCRNNTTCSCVHIEEIQTGSSVEVTIVDQTGDSNENVFHLHGYQFYVIAYSNSKIPSDLEKIKEMDAKGTLFKRNLENPVLKDTIRIPKHGAVSFRFLADNPGFWILRDEMSLDWTRGIDVIFHVGTCCDMPSTPSDFPKCGDWVGSDFFLL